MQTISEKEATKNPTLEQLIGKESEIKTMLVDYVGETLDRQDVTVQMIIEVLSDQFPEFVLAVAEENWIRGYHQALEDVDAGRNAQLAEQGNAV
tara:strand:+ start:162 stop:443 length:282 start_codon:yes stop_codon:yes gene_type:complete